MKIHEHPKDLATVQAVSAIGSLSYLSALITDRDSAIYIYTQLCAIGKKIRVAHNIETKAEKQREKK